MRRRIPVLITISAIVVAVAASAVPSASAGDYVPFATINAAPGGAKVAAGQHIEGAELTNTRPLANGAVGPLPVYMADDKWGCVWATAAASGGPWIGLAQRDSAIPPTDPTDFCITFEARVAAAEAAGAAALIIINDADGTAVGTAAGGIPAVIVDKTLGQNLRDSIPDDHSKLQLTLGLLDAETFLPPGVISPTTVGSLAATKGTGTVSVSGSAAFGGQAPISVGVDDTGDGPTSSVNPQIDQNTGVDLTGADVGQPDPANPVLQFRWHTTGLPSTGALPEFTFYRWGLTVNGKTNYVLQAKFSNLISTAWLDDQTGPATSAGATFQLRGNCGPLSPAPVNNCHSLAFLTGTFDPSSKTVTFDLPLGESYAPDIVPGAVITPFNYDAQPIVAGYSAGVANSSTEDGMDWDTEAIPSYTIPSETVLLGIAPAGTNVSQVNFAAHGTLGDEGSFTGSISTSGLATGSYDVWAKACFAGNCGLNKVTIAL